MTDGVVLGDVAAVNPRGAPAADPDDPVSFVAMADLDAVAAVARPSSVRTFAEVAKGYTVFRNGDLLVAKITPCWENAKIGRASLEHPVGAGSTEFHVVRPTEAVDGGYLLHLLRQPAVLTSGERRMTGSGGQRRVPASYLQQLPIPLPAVEEQRRIAALLDRAARLAALRREQLARLDAFSRSLFHWMFTGEPGPEKALGDVAAFAGGASLPAGEPFRGEPGGTLLMKVSDMNLPGNEVEIVGTARWADGPGPRSATVDAGAVVLPKRGASIATNKKRMTTRRTTLDPNLMGVVPHTDVVECRYVYEWFRSFDLASITSGSTVPQLNKQDLAPLAVPVPPLAQQREFVARLELADARRAAVLETTGLHDELFASLRSRAFRGEL